MHFASSLFGALINLYHRVIHAEQGASADRGFKASPPTVYELQDCRIQVGARRLQ